VVYIYIPHKYRSFSEFSNSLDIIHQSEKCDFLTTETYFWNVLLNSNVIPPDGQDLCFDFGGAILDDIALKPEMLTETLDQVSVKNTKS
jgi:hypothetical protein